IELSKVGRHDGSRVHNFAFNSSRDKDPDVNRPVHNEDRTSPAPSSIARIFPKATSRGRYLRPQSGATTIRSALTNGSARRMRMATVSGVSMLWVDKSRTPRIMVF